MSFRSFGPALAAALLAAACATAPAPESAPSPQTGAAAGLDPVGTFSFSSQTGGENFTGTIHITRTAAGAYGGTIATPLTGDLPVRAVEVQDRHIRVTADGRMGAAVMEMDVDVDGTRFTGSWEYGGSRGLMAGTRGSGAEASAPPPALGEPGTEYAGNYDLPGTGLQVRIFEESGRLMAHATGQRPFPLLYMGEHRFQAPAAVGIGFDFAVADGRATGFTLHQHGRTYQANRIP